jgi:O-antigen/teichoic acid export membrane protein
MTSVSRPGPGASPSDLVGAARGGALSFVGAAFAAAMGFVLTLVVARLLGSSGAGVFFQVVALFTILFNVAELGADTGLVWALPRLRVQGRITQVRHALRIAVLPVVLVSAVFAAAVFAASDLLAGWLVDPEHQAAAATAFRAVSPFLVLAAPLTVLLGATRGMGSLKPFIGIWNVGLPAVRPLAVALTVGSGAGLVGAVLGWAAPLALALVATAVALGRQVSAVRPLRRARRLEQVAVATETTRDFWRFSAPRGVSAVIEIVILWADVILLGALRSAAEAGAYAAASRFITSGTLAESALRVALAPEYSALLAAGETQRARKLYSASSAWIVLLSWPLFLTLAVFAPTVMTLFGDDFRQAAPALAVLSVGMMTSLAAGNVQTLLLMSGRSGIQLTNKVLALVTNLTLNLILIPVLGILGAAIAWTATIMVDTGAALVRLERASGIVPDWRGLARAAVPALVCYGAGGLAVARLVGQHGGGLAVAALLGTVAYAGWVWRARRGLELGLLGGVIRRRPAAPGPGAPGLAAPGLAAPGPGSPGPGASAGGRHRKEQ